jgi:UDP-N-acetylmuramyl pentapeptide phosphotransferase/UDP-N-acetylglucosamine-1-phosphate transferase
MKPTAGPDLFPSFDSIEPVIWPGVAIGVFAATAILVDVMIVLAARWRLVDLPNRRSAHALPTARGGGAAIVLTTLLASLAAVYRWPPAAAQVLAGICLPCLVIALVGIMDDIQPLRATLRLVIQIAVGVTMTAILGPLESIGIPGVASLHLGAAGWPLTILWIVGMTNAFNFMDGSDGMAGLAAVVGGVVLTAIGWQTGHHLPLLLAAFAAAAAGGFLVFNWPPARVFMGDVGSAFLGTFLAAIPLLFPEPVRGGVIVAAVLGLWPSIFDPLVSVCRRIANGANPLVPHREFFFHRIIRSGATHGYTARLYGLLAALGGVAGLVMLDRDVPAAGRAAMPFAVAAASLGLAWFAERRFAASPAAAAAMTGAGAEAAAPPRP